MFKIVTIGTIMTVALASSADDYHPVNEDLVRIIKDNIKSW